MLKKLHKILGIQNSVEEEKEKFVKRINQTLFSSFNSNCPFNELAYYIGKDPIYSDLSSIFAHRMSENESTLIFRELTEDNFEKTIIALCFLYQKFDTLGTNERDIVDRVVRNAFEFATVDLGVRWKNGTIYSSGDAELDQKLIEYPLDWLDNYPNEKENFAKALQHYLKKEWGDTISNCYLSVEGLIRTILKNKKTLENNKEGLLQKLKLSQEWRSFLSNYIGYANEFGRHASEKRHSIEPSEVEAFLYFTGLIIRLIIQAG